MPRAETYFARSARLRPSGAPKPGISPRRPNSDAISQNRLCGYSAGQATLEKSPHPNPRNGFSTKAAFAVAHSPRRVESSRTKRESAASDAWVHPDYGNRSRHENHQESPSSQETPQKNPGQEADGSGDYRATRPNRYESNTTNRHTGVQKRPAGASRLGGPPPPRVQRQTGMRDPVWLLRCRLDRSSSSAPPKISTIVATRKPLPRTTQLSSPRRSRTSRRRTGMQQTMTPVRRKKSRAFWLW